MIAYGTDEFDGKILVGPVTKTVYAIFVFVKGDKQLYKIYNKGDIKTRKRATKKLRELRSKFNARFVLEKIWTARDLKDVETIPMQFMEDTDGKENETNSQANRGPTNASANQEGEQYSTEEGTGTSGGQANTQNQTDKSGNAGGTGPARPNAQNTVSSGPDWKQWTQEEIEKKIGEIGIHRFRREYEGHWEDYDDNSGADADYDLGRWPDEAEPVNQEQWDALKTRLRHPNRPKSINLGRWPDNDERE
jgi:hypothetical protein